MTEVQLTTNDIQQIKAYGLTLKKVLAQLETFVKGVPFIKLVNAANINDGIIPLSAEEKKAYISKYEKATLKTVKFVPASGAATRMFKLLSQFISEFNSEENTLKQSLAAENFQPLQGFFDKIEAFAFYKEAMLTFKNNFPQHQVFSKDEFTYKFVKFLLEEDGLGFSNLPKGLVPFHVYKDKTVTAFEEHLLEASVYASSNGVAKLHFTIAEEALGKFEQLYKNVQKRVEATTGLNFEITYSFQKKITDTIAVDKNNEPVRTKDGKLCFRPGGHGALIENLNDINADIIFIKNIDNVVTEKNLPLIANYKKALGGILLTVQKQIHNILIKIDEGTFTEETLEEANQLLKDKLSIKTNLTSAEEVKEILNRPIRVCGMVKNEGAPGGGPFWTINKKDVTSLQIVESAQINIEDKTQREIAQNATHFNPVDLVCGVKNHKGEKFNLLDFVNPENGFITHKNIGETPIKALELPGLWNGAMAYWNTIFVEVPLVTFNPVKTVLDLLKPEHQPS